MKYGLILLVCALALSGCGSKPATPTHGRVRVAVIGGMMMTGLWQELTKDFQQQTGLELEVVVTGPKETLVPVFCSGGVDVLTMHSCDEATGLVAEGYAVQLRPWTWNEHVIMGPTEDPAGIKGLKDGATALRKIAQTQSRFVDAQGGGKRLIAEKLWEKAGIRPSGNWLLKDESSSPTALLAFAEKNHSYVICGRIPVLWNKLPKGGLDIMVEGDPAMKRPYVVIEANPHKFPGTYAEGARALSDYLVGEKGQSFLSKFKPERSGLLPVFYPLASSKSAIIP